MAIRLVREPSDTPNINNTDDFVGLRYAYGDNNGYVKGRGNECDYEINGLNFTIKSGRLVVDGVEVDIPSGGETITATNPRAELRYLIYAEVNLATNSAEIKSIFSSGSDYPTISKGDDLTVNTVGTARIELYTFVKTAANLIITIEKKVKAIPYPLRGYDLSKGTVEERLTALGFKQGSVTPHNDVSATTNILKRQGKYCILNYNITATTSIYIPGDGVVIGNIPTDFLSKENIYAYALGSDKLVSVRITTAGEIIYPQTAGYSITSGQVINILNVGYETV